VVAVFCSWSLSKTSIHINDVELPASDVPGSTVNAEIVDLAVALRRRVGLRAPKFGRNYTYIELIADGANKLGGAHKAEKIPKALDRLERQEVFGSSAYVKWLLLAAEEILQMGEYVVRESQKSNLST